MKRRTPLAPLQINVSATGNDWSPLNSAGLSGPSPLSSAGLTGRNFFEFVKSMRASSNLAIIVFQVRMPIKKSVRKVPFSSVSRAAKRKKYV